MKNQNILLFIFLVLFLMCSFLSCTKKDQSYTDKATVLYGRSDFKNNISLKSKELSKISDSLFLPLNTEIIGDYLIILDNNGEHAIHVVNLIKEKYQGSFIKKGQGPNEILVPWFISKITDSTFLVYDAGSRKILGFHIDSLLRNKKLLFEKKFNQKDLLTSMKIIGENTYYTSYLNSSNRFFKKNLKSDKEQGYGTLLKNYRNASDVNFAQACIGNLDFENGKIITSYRFAPFFEIYNVELKKWKSILTIDNFSPMFKEIESEGEAVFSFSKKTKLGIVDIELSNQFIYLLYSGQNMFNSKHKMEVGKKILVFDYNGNPITIYDLDKELCSFEVYKDSIIYGIHNDLKAELVKFNIKNYTNLE
jgi:hypothetical protein